MARVHGKKGGSKTKARQSVMAPKAAKLKAPYNDEQQAWLRMFEPKTVPPADVLDKIAEDLFWGVKPNDGTARQAWRQNTTLTEDGAVDRSTVCPDCFQLRSLLGGCGCEELPGHGAPAHSADPRLFAARWGITPAQASQIMDRIARRQPIDHMPPRPQANPVQGKFNQRRPR